MKNKPHLLIASVILLLVAAGCLCYHVGYQDGYLRAVLVITGASR